MLPAKIFLLGILIFKGLTVWRLYKSFGIKGLTGNEKYRIIKAAYCLFFLSGSHVIYSLADQPILIVCLQTLLVLCAYRLHFWHIYLSKYDSSLSRNIFYELCLEWSLPSVCAKVEKIFVLGISLCIYCSVARFLILIGPKIFLYSPEANNFINALYLWIYFIYFVILSSVVFVNTDVLCKYGL
jgi:hypothetical protein